MITATYSAEDNKLRLYPSERLDAETFNRVKAAGYRWAPRQELFVAPKWTPQREDLAIELAGEIEAEEMTLAERAQAKAARLDDLAHKRAQEATGFSRAARDISERFAMGQPILVGHHSERKALKDRERMDAAQSKAVKAADASAYWLYRAEGVERHANYKNDPRVRARRIKTLLAELRDLQRPINEAHKRLDHLKLIQAVEDAEKRHRMVRAFAGGASVSIDLYFKLDKGEIEPDDALRQIVESCEITAHGPNRARCIQHTLNRLAFERSFLGDVPRFSGDITATVLQAFVREHGGDKPKGAKGEGDLWQIETAAPLPAHIGDGCAIEMGADEWRDLMQACGYVPPEKKPAKPPLLNFKSPQVAIKRKFAGAKVEVLRQVEMTAADYKAQRDAGWICPSECGAFRVRTCSDPEDTRAYYLRGRVAVFLTDSKEHPAPEGYDRAQPGFKWSKEAAE